VEEWKSGRAEEKRVEEWKKTRREKRTHLPFIHSSVPPFGETGEGGGNGGRILTSIGKG
jgi:hypothetical protein